LELKIDIEVSIWEMEGDADGLRVEELSLQ
jgi:hypothetical protein